MIALRTLATALVALLLATAARAAEPVVDVGWLKANLAKPGVVVLDVRSGGGITKAEFAAAHIPGAIFTDYGKDGWRAKIDGVAGMLPPIDKVEALVGSLGIANDTHVVLVPAGEKAADMGAATRIYWTLKVLGHDEVSILDGGFAAWVAERDATTKAPVNPLAQGMSKPEPKAFKASPRPELIANEADVAAAMTSQQPLVDNRPYDFYVGLTKSPVAKTAGTIPGAVSLPEGWLTADGGGTFRSKAELAKIYSAAAVPQSGKQINFCNTGHWASLGWFVSSEILGNKQARVYDGSMASWTADAKREVDQKIKLK